MMNRLRDSWPWIVIVCALVCILPTLAMRMGAERSAGQVELIMDLDEAGSLARWWGLELDEVLRQMKSRGLTSAAIPEISLTRLHDRGDITLITGSEILARSRTAPLGSALKELAPLVVSSGYLYAIVDDPGLAADIESRAARRPALEFRRSTHLEQTGQWVLEFGGSHDDLRDAGLGFAASDFELARRVGLNAVPRPHNLPDACAEEIQDIVRSFGDGTSMVISHGSECLGYPEAVDDYARALTDAGIVPGMVESPQQRGFIFLKGGERLAEASDYRICRVFSIGRLELDRIGGDEATDQMIRAVRERNIRALYLRPLVARSYQGRELDATLAMIGDLSDGLSAAGLDIGPALPFPRVEVGSWVIVAAGAGVLAAGALIARPLWPGSPGLPFALWTAAFAGWMALLVVSPAWARLAAGLGAASMFPVAAVVTGMSAATADSAGRPVMRAIAGLVIASACSLAGAALMTVILGDSRYLLEFDYFRGVKLSYLLPLGLLCVVLARGDERKPRAVIARLSGQVRVVLGREVSARDLIAVAAVLAVAYIYLGRTGHEAGLPVPALEMATRQTLERLLSIRPRVKEFLIGHPALVAGSILYASGIIRGLSLWQLVAVTGQVSIINSFSHLRTPFLLSLTRTAHGVWLGAAVGVAAAIIWLAACRASRSGGRRRS